MWLETLRLCWRYLFRGDSNSAACVVIWAMHDVNNKDLQLIADCVKSLQEFRARPPEPQQEEPIDERIFQMMCTPPM